LALSNSYQLDTPIRGMYPFIGGDPSYRMLWALLQFGAPFIGRVVLRHLSWIRTASYRCFIVVFSLAINWLEYWCCDPLIWVASSSKSAFEPIDSLNPSACNQCSRSLRVDTPVIGICRVFLSGVASFPFLIQIQIIGLAGIGRSDRNEPFGMQCWSS